MALKVDVFQSFFDRIGAELRRLVLPVNVDNYSNFGKSYIQTVFDDQHKVRAGLPVGLTVFTGTKAELEALGAGIYKKIASLTSPHPFAHIMEKVVINCNRKITACFGTTPVTANFPGYTQYMTLQPNVDFVIPLNSVLRGGDEFFVSLKKWLDTDVSDYEIRVTFFGETVANEPVQNAKVRAQIVADSINAGISATLIENMYNWQFRNELRLREVSFSIPYNKSVSGSGSEQHLRYFRNGRYVSPDVNVYIIALGANDFSIYGKTKAQYKAIFIEMINLILSSESTPLIILQTPPLHENDAYETVNVQFREALTEINTTYLSLNRVFLIDIATNSFDRKVTTNYMPSDTAGSRIHPSDIGNAAIFTNCIIPFLNSSRGQTMITELKKLK